MGIETVATAILPMVGTIVDLFRKHNAKKNAIVEDLHRKNMGEHIMRPLVAMYAALSKADSSLNIYFLLVSKSQGAYRDILIQNQSQFFLTSVQDYLRDFADNLNYFDRIGDRGGTQVVQSVKGNACAAMDRYDKELQAELSHYTNIRNSGGQPTSNDIITVIEKFQKFIDCYYEGVNWTLLEIAHIK